MSTGASCTIYEKERGQWYYRLQRYPYGATPEYDTFGPFETFREADEHLAENHGNPGGYNHRALPGCPHDLARVDFRGNWVCDRCGGWGEKVEAAAKRPRADRTVWHRPDGWYYKFIGKNPLAKQDGVCGPYTDEFTAKQFLSNRAEVEDLYYPQVKELRKALKGTRSRKRGER